MSKIKINLLSGNTVEKPLVTCFKNSNGLYLVLDNESNGSMGYPIICISKFNGQSAEKIFDQAEWTAVKESLKTIISGTNLEYVNVPEVITANDDFYTQLTLPLASFDLLKNVYNPAPAVVSEPETPAAVQGTVAPVEEAPSIQTPEPVISPNVIATPSFEMSTAQSIPQMVMPETPEQSVNVVSPVVPEVPTSVITPDVPNTSNIVTNDDIAMMKETFMKSCENMFDALVKKFENK